MKIAAASKKQLEELIPYYTIRYTIKPGITGWAQVNGRNALTWEERFELDVWYVDNQSFFLDLKIIILTAMKVLKREGVEYQGGEVESRFKGSEKEVEK